MKMELDEEMNPAVMNTPSHSSQEPVYHTEIRVIKEEDTWLTQSYQVSQTDLETLDETQREIKSEVKSEVKEVKIEVACSPEDDMDEATSHGSQYLPPNPEPASPVQTAAPKKDEKEEKEDWPEPEEDLHSINPLLTEPQQEKHGLVPVSCQRGTHMIPPEPLHYVTMVLLESVAVDTNKKQRCTDWDGEENIVDYLLSRPFHTLQHAEKVRVKEAGRPTAQIQVVRNNKPGQHKTVQLNAVWLDKFSWLTGSPKTKRLYCWPCILMSSKNNFNTWSAAGFNDLRNLDRATKRHDSSKEHIAANTRLKLFGQVSVKEVIHEGARLQRASHNTLVRRNRDALVCLIDAAAYLGMQELSFGGHHERQGSANKGNFRELVDLVARSDSTLAEHIGNSTLFSQMSDTIQKDLIVAITSTIKSEIKRELETAPFFACQINETNVSGDSCRLSAIIRYVDGKGTIQERFLGFRDVKSGRDAQALFEFVQSELSVFNFVEKLVAQSYDGAAVTASDFSELQAKVRAVAPSVVSVPCYSHHLNLLISQGLRSIPKARIFFATLNGFSSYFCKSTERGVVILENSVCSKVPGSACTHWNFPSHIVNTLAKNREGLADAFTRIINHPTMDNESIWMADGLRAKLEDLEFVFLLLTCEQIFSRTDVVFNLLQTKAPDVSFCKKSLKALVDTMEELKSEEAFEKIFKSAADVTEDPTWTHKRKQRQGSDDPRQTYKALYDAILTSAKHQICQRYQNLECLRFMELLDSDKFLSFKMQFPSYTFKCLEDNYGRFFDVGRLKSELQVYYSNREIHCGNIKLCESLESMKASGMSDAMPELYRLKSLIATIGFTSAGAERGFSCLERLKSYSKDTKGEERLGNLAILAIERKILRSLMRNPQWYEKAIDIFAAQTSKTKDFTFM